MRTAIGPLNPVIRLLPDPVIRPPFAADGKDIRIEGQVDVFALQARRVRLDLNELAVGVSRTRLTTGVQGAATGSRRSVRGLYGRCEECVFIPSGMVASSRMTFQGLAGAVELPGFMVHFLL